jgi:hypothetical protein
MQDAPPVVGEDDEHEENPAGERGYREEVDGDGGADMVLEERPPAIWIPRTTMVQHSRLSPCG